MKNLFLIKIAKNNMTKLKKSKGRDEILSTGERI